LKGPQSPSKTCTKTQLGAWNALKNTHLQLWLKLGQKIYINGPTCWYAKIMATRDYNGVFWKERGAYLYSLKGTQLLSFFHGKLIAQDFHPNPSSLFLTFYIGPFSNFWRLTSNHKQIVPWTSESHFYALKIPHHFFLH